MHVTAMDAGWKGTVEVSTCLVVGTQGCGAALVRVIAMDAGWKGTVELSTCLIGRTQGCGAALMCCSTVCSTVCIV